MFTKNEVIEILEKALANPNYLADRRNPQSTIWFCSSVTQVIVERTPNGSWKKQSDEQTYICETYIYPSINEQLFLKTYLLATGAISEGVMYQSNDYHVAAKAHWQALIDKLKSEI